MINFLFYVCIPVLLGMLFGSLTGVCIIESMAITDPHEMAAIFVSCWITWFMVVLIALLEL